MAQKNNNRIAVVAAVSGAVTGGSLAALIVQEANYNRLQDCVVAPTITTVPTATTVPTETTVVDTYVVDTTTLTTSVTPITAGNNSTGVTHTVRPATPTTARQGTSSTSSSTTSTTTTVRQTTTTTVRPAPTTTQAPAPTTTHVSGAAVSTTAPSHGHDDENDD